VQVHLGRARPTVAGRCRRSPRGGRRQVAHVCSPALDPACDLTLSRMRTTWSASGRSGAARQGLPPISSVGPLRRARRRYRRSPPARRVVERRAQVAAPMPPPPPVTTADLGRPAVAARVPASCITSWVCLSRGLSRALGSANPLCAPRRGDLLFDVNCRYGLIRGPRNGGGRKRRTVVVLGGGPFFVRVIFCPWMFVLFVWVLVACCTLVCWLGGFSSFLSRSLLPVEESAYWPRVRHASWPRWARFRRADGVSGGATPSSSGRITSNGMDACGEPPAGRKRRAWPDRAATVCFAIAGTVFRGSSLRPVDESGVVRDATVPRSPASGTSSGGRPPGA